MSDPQRPADADARPFWESCRAHAMALPRCTSCGSFRFPPRALCPRCGSGATAWARVAGTGRVWASLIVAHALTGSQKGNVPFNLSLVELDEGVRMWTNVVGCDPDDVRIGDLVRVRYEEAEGRILPRFTRVPEAS